MYRITLQPLKGFNAFASVFEHGVRFAYRGITAFVVFRSSSNSLSTPTATHDAANNTVNVSVPQSESTPSNEHNTVLLGVTAKKRTRPAVLRNRIKRILRASTRKAMISDKLRGKASHLAAWNEEQPFPIHTILLVCNIIPQKPQQIGLYDVLPQVRRIIRLALEYAQKHVPPRDLLDAQQHVIDSVHTPPPAPQYSTAPENAPLDATAFESASLFKIPDSAI